MRHYFSLSQLNATAKFSQVFMLTQNKTIQWGFEVSVFGNCDREVLRKMKTKAMVLVIAKMNMKVHFNFLYENFVKMLVFIKVFGLMDVVWFSSRSHP